MWLRTALRRASPEKVRIGVALARRKWRDLGERPRLAQTKTLTAAAFPHPVVELVQEIRKSAFFEGKLENIRRGAALLDGVVVAPGETFSFWELVGRPSAKAGFELGRSIRGGSVSGDVGGGLCQLSGIAYEAGLRAGLDPVERHPHSRDLYTEEERFTPLGLDATVVWPYKDMRMANRLAAPVRLRFAVRELMISAAVHAPGPMEPAQLDVSRVDHLDRREVRVRRTTSGVTEEISDDRYVFAR